MRKTPKEIYAQARDSMVVIHTSRGQGSGVVVGDNEVVTNCHVVDDGGPIEVGKMNADGRVEGKPIRASVAAAHMSDLCLLRAPGLRARPLNIGSAKNLQVGDPIYALGAPQGHPLTLSSGLVSQVRGDPSAPLIQTDAAVDSGSSGGAVFDSEGLLAGITYMAGGDGRLNFALPADLIQPLRGNVEAEAPIRKQFLDCMEVCGKGRGRHRMAHGGKAPAMSEISNGFRQVALGIIELQDPAGRAGIFGRIMRAEARSGNKFPEFAKLIAEWGRGADSQEMLDAINFQSAWCHACMGGFGQAVKIAGQIKGEYFHLAARAVIAAQRAHAGHISAAREWFGDVARIRQKAEGDLLCILAWSLAEMNHTSEAFDCAEALRNSGDYVGMARALSSIAGVQARRGCYTGAAALFQSAHEFSERIEDDDESQGGRERVLSLGYIAWDEAACKPAGEMWAERAQISARTAADIMMSGGMDYGRYSAKIEGWTRIAEAAAKAGELSVALRAVGRTPVLCDDFAVAVGYVAIAIDDAIEADERAPLRAGLGLNS